MSRLFGVLDFNLKPKFKSFLFAFLIVALIMPIGAVTWSDYETRLTTYVDFDGIPCIIETSDRALWIFWTRKMVGHYNIFYVNSADWGASWSQETQLTVNGSANTGVSAFQASDGAIWIVWASSRTGNYEIFYKTSSNLGVSWSNDTQLTFHPGQDLKPVIRQMSDGSIWIAWSSSRSGGYDLYLKISFDNGYSWSDDIILTNDSSLDKMPCIAQMSDGTIWVVWASSRTGNYDLYLKTSSNFGVSWSNDTQLTGGPRCDSNPDILRTIDGKIWIFWSSREASETADDDIYYMLSSDGGATWSDSVQFTTDKCDDTWPSVVQTRLVKIWVVWTSDRADQPDWGNYDIYYRTSLVGDVNSDGVVDVVDLARVSMAFGSFKGEPQYDPEADINVDRVVDIRDITLVSVNLGST